MKAKLLSVIILLCACMPLFSQKKPIVDENGIYISADKMPEFPGGMQAMMKYLGTNVKYPVEAQKKGVSGRVIVQFIVMEDGSLSGAKVIRGVEPSLDEEALRVVNAMPKWTPGTVDGKEVKVKFTIPIMYNLRKNESRTPPPSNLVIPIGQEIKNKTLLGVWQTCRVATGEDGYKLSFGTLLKFISPDNTFMNIIVDISKMGSVIMAQGEYETESDNIYVEKLSKSIYSAFPPGVKNKIAVERLHDNLIKMTFKLPGQDEPLSEYWYRVQSPDIKILAQ